MTMFRPIEGPGRPGPWSWLFNVVWAAVFAVGLWTTLDHGRPPWVWILCGAGLAAWMVRAVVPDRLRAAQISLEFAMLVTGGLAAFSASVVGGVPLAVGLILLIGRPERPLRLALAALPVALAALGAGALLAHPPQSASLGLLLGCLGTFAIAALLGLSRRQARTAEARTRELEEERRRNERLDDHARVARDLHDVLAHGLGGLVVQLDAVDALLETGRTAEAAERIRAARGLAVEGLHDARRAVDALRSDDSADPPVAPSALSASLGELVAAHRGLGGLVDAEIDPAPRPVAAATASALRRTLQESLSNARKHAAGAPVVVRFRPEGDRLVLEVENPIGPPSALAATGGGRGIAGMEERLTQLDGGSLRAGRRDGRFAVRAEVPA